MVDRDHLLQYSARLEATGIRQHEREFGREKLSMGGQLMEGVEQLKSTLNKNKDVSHSYECTQLYIEAS